MAKEQGYKSRAAFKLLEAVKKYRLIKAGDIVLDFGAAPGGWLQVAAETVGAQGLVVGVDLVMVSLSDENVVSVQSDVNSPELPAMLERILPRKADVVLSDLSPQVSGVWDLDHFRQTELTLASVSLMERFIRRRGNAMLKIFDGERFLELRSHLTKRFETVHVIKPQASRKASSELYLLCLDYSFEQSTTAPTTSA